MKAEEILQSVREARQQMMDDFEGKSFEEIRDILNESGRRMMEESEQRRRAAAQSSSHED